MQVSNDSTYDLTWRKRMAMQIASSAVPPDVDTGTQIEILQLAIEVLQSFVLGTPSTTSERPVLSVVPLTPRS